MSASMCSFLMKRIDHKNIIFFAKRAHQVNARNVIPLFRLSKPSFQKPLTWTCSRPSLCFSQPCRCLSTEAEAAQPEEEENYHSIIKNTERSKGPADKHEFQADTRQLLDIVARSLYSEKEVFVREIISNASDALEKLRYLQLMGETITDTDIPFEIHIGTDEDKKTFTIQDTGVGMTQDELIDNLGTIARSGSKAFVESLKEKQSSSDIGSNMIGQFGVGFYSTFMVAEKVDIYSQSYKPDAQAFKWSSDGSGTYELAEAEGVQRGSKIVIHLRGDCYDYAKEDVIKEVLTRYSNFVGVPIYLNGKRANIIQALWMLDPKDVTDDMHDEFYRFIGNVYDKPRYHFHYKTDAPLNIRALFYVPEYKPTLFDMSRETDVNMTLYSRKVMILAKANNILPRWLRFIKGVVDSEDIPLNLSRELLQDSNLIRKLRNVITNRVLKFFLEQSKKDHEKYMKFYEDYGLFFREGIVTTMEQDQREEIAKLLRFESSMGVAGEKTSLQEYCEKMKAGERNIYYLSTPSRHLAESSPYYEAFKKRNIEVLFLYEPYDELVLMNLNQYDRKTLKSIENELHHDVMETDTIDSQDGDSLSQEHVDALISWLSGVLTNKVNNIKVTKQLESHPCLVTVVEMGSARHFLKTTMADKSQEERYRLLQPTLEINPSHVLIKKMHQLYETEPELATLLGQQLYENAMIHAGLVDDPRSSMNNLNELLMKALEKH